MMQSVNEIVLKSYIKKLLFCSISTIRWWRTDFWKMRNKIRTTPSHTRSRKRKKIHWNNQTSIKTLNNNPSFTSESWKYLITYLPLTLCTLLQMQQLWFQVNKKDKWLMWRQAAHSHRNQEEVEIDWDEDLILKKIVERSKMLYWTSVILKKDFWNFYRNVWIQ